MASRVYVGEVSEVKGDLREVRGGFSEVRESQISRHL